MLGTYSYSANLARRALDFDWEAVHNLINSDTPLKKLTEEQRTLLRTAKTAALPDVNSNNYIKARNAKANVPNRLAVSLQTVRHQLEISWSKMTFAVALVLRATGLGNQVAA